LERFTSALPEESGVDQNYPNPFNGSTIVPFTLSKAAEVDLGIYNMNGQRVATLAAGWRQTGIYALHWDGRDDFGRELASGIYLYRLRIGGEQVATRKLTLVR
jgi:flagellar hook assembly protein FlgD